MNLYGYVLQDPINKIDVNGKNVVRIAIGAAIFGTVAYQCYKVKKAEIDRAIRPINDVKDTPATNDDGTKRDEFERIYDGNATEDMDE